MKLPCSRFTEIFEVKGHSAWLGLFRMLLSVELIVGSMFCFLSLLHSQCRDRVACVVGAGKYHVDIIMGSIKNVAREGNTRGEKVLSFACIIVSRFPFFPVPLLSNRSQLNI